MFVDSKNLAKCLPFIYSFNNYLMIMRDGAKSCGAQKSNQTWMPPSIVHYNLVGKTGNVDDKGP